MALFAADPGPLRAYELVMGFAARRGEAALRLAMHAALPQVLRVELLHLLRLNFLPEAAGDLALEADVLFAPFCEDIGNGYYCFAATARVQLLQGLDPAYGKEPTPRSIQVARFMLDYLAHEERDVRGGSDRLRADWIAVERWSALAFAEPALAAGHLAAALARATADDDIAARVRVTGLATALATPLAHFGELLAYAEGVEALQLGRAAEAGRLFEAMPDREIEIEGIRLKSPRRVLAESLGREKRPAPEVASPAPVEPQTQAPGEEAQQDEGPLEQAAGQRDLIYISSSHRDQEWRERLETHLKRLGLAVWTDSQIAPGEHWEAAIAHAIGRARLAIVLVSADYLASEDLTGRELAQLVKLARSGELSLTWICVRPCAWNVTPLAQFQAAHDPSKALAELSRAGRDSVFREIVTRANDLLRSDQGGGREGASAEMARQTRDGIFIVYRRDDAGAYAIRLYEGLRVRFGERVFMDVHDIRPGEDFREAIGGAIGRAGVLIVLIGPTWIGSRQADGLRRIDSPEDLVRVEVVKALGRGMPVLPVLVGGATLPSASELPDDLRRLVQPNAEVLRDAEWEKDLDRLAGDLGRLNPELLDATPAVQAEDRPGLQPLKIYLAATTTDLAREREAVINALRRLGHEVVGVESEAATLPIPLEKAYADIAACEVVLCIIAWRYGFVPADSAGNPERRSIVELEYRRGMSLGKPTLAFMLDEEAPWDPKAMDTRTGEGEKGERISAFRRELMSQHTVSLFRSADELTTSVLSAIRVMAQRGKASPEPQAAAEDLAEAKQLLQEIERPETTHSRRAEIGDRLNEIGDPRSGLGVRSDGTPDLAWREIPAGVVQLERAEGEFDVERFFISQYPVTYRQYRAFLEDPQGYASKRWWEGLRHEKQPGKQSRHTDNCPAENVSWHDALAYCRWASTRLGVEVTLPTEWQWQQAATGGDAARHYPWGSEWEDGRANTVESRLSRTTAVGLYPAGATAQGVLDMAGNVWEWCLNKLDPPKDTSIGGDARRVVRGGSWLFDRGGARCALRDLYDPGLRDNDLGFRVVCVSPIR